MPRAQPFLSSQQAFEAYLPENAVTAFEFETCQGSMCFNESPEGWYAYFL